MTTKTNHLFCLKLNILPRTDQLLPLPMWPHLILTVSLLVAKVFQSPYEDTICIQCPFSIQKQFLSSSLKKKIGWSKLADLSLSPSKVALSNLLVSLRAIEWKLLRRQKAVWPLFLSTFFNLDYGRLIRLILDYSLTVMCMHVITDLWNSIIDPYFSVNHHSDRPFHQMWTPSYSCTQEDCWAY